MPQNAFSISVEEFAKKCGIEVGIVTRKAALDLLQSCIAHSPVDTGRFRASWRISVGSIDTSIAPEVLGQKAQKMNSPSEALGQATQLMTALSAESLKTGSPIFISNSMPYALALEYGASRQAQAGIVRLAILEVQADLQRDL